MDSGEARELPSAGADEETIARKRSRRVSFAETTAVHVFDRDEDFETPPDLKPTAAADNGAGLALGFQGERSDNEDSRGTTREGEEEGEEEDDDDGEQEKFIRDMDLVSPGSTAGSMTSNDEDNFFGPVSTSFIRSGRYSDAGFSEDNNPDITLDSTAFSLHFRNIAPPNDCSGISAGSIRTPTGDSMPADPGSSMVPTVFKKLIPRDTISDGKVRSSAGDSNSMSLISRNAYSYDYGKISPTLEALLAEVNKSLQPNSSNGSVAVLASEPSLNEVSDANSSVLKQAETVKAAPPTDEAIDQFPDSHQLNVSSVDIITKATLPRDSSPKAKTAAAVSPVRKDSSAGVVGLQSDILATGTQKTDLLSPQYRLVEDISQLEYGYLQHSILRVQASGSKSNTNSSPNSAQKIPILLTDGHQQQSESEYGIQTPKSSVQPFQSPLQVSVSSLRAKRQRLFLDSAVLSQGKLIQSPGKEQPPSSIKMELVRHGDRISAIKNSISKFKVPESPKPANIKPSMSENEHKSPDLQGHLQSRNYNHGAKHFDLTDTPLVVKSIKSSQMSGEQETSSESIRSEGKILNGTSIWRQNIQNDTCNGTVNMTGPLSSFQFSSSKLERKGTPSSSQNPAEDICTPNENQTMNSTSNVISSPAVVNRNDSSSFHDGCLTPSAVQVVDSIPLLKENTFQSNASHCLNKGGKLESPNEMIRNDISPDNLLKEAEHTQDIHFSSQVDDVGMRKGVNGTRKILSIKGVNIESCGSVSDDVGAANLDIVIKETAQNPADRTTSTTVSNIGHSLHIMETMSPKSTQNQRQHGRWYPYHEQQVLPGSYSIEEKKRRIEQVISRVNDISETSRRQKSLKFLPEVAASSPEFSTGNGGAFVVGGQAPPKHWNDILSTAVLATKELFAPSISTLSSKELDILEDMLAELQTARKYERLCAEIRSLRNDNLGDLQQQRVAEARVLRDMLVHEQAKLRLRRVKLVQLQKKVQQSQWAVQESHKLKMNLTKLYEGPAQRKGQHLFLVPTICKTNSQEQKIKVVSMRQELEMLDQKVMRLMKSFESSFKIKRGASCEGIIKVVSEHLEVKKHSRAIHRDLHLWKLSDLVNENDQRRIVLNYCDMLSQRFDVNISPVAAIVVNNLLNDENIEKKFPDMNAHLVFASVFNPKNDHRLPCSRSFQQETLVTNFLLGNLLVVLEEIQAARLEISSLVSSTFQPQSSGQLALHLCFLCFKSGRKVTLSINMIQLKCGVYCSDPSDVNIKISEAQSTLPKSVADEIMHTIQILQTGRAMILRLCRSVSQVLQASS